MQKYWEKEDWERLKSLVTKYGKQKVAESAILIAGRREYLEAMGDKYIEQDKKEKYQWSVF